MRSAHGFWWRLRHLFRSGEQSDADLRDQINAHLDEATEEFEAQGLSPADARRAARRSFGSVVQAEETSRDIRGRWMQDLAKDLRYGLRSLRRNPAFTAVAFVSLAIGLGANTAIFSIVNAVLLRPRPVANPDQFVEIYIGHRGEPYESSSYPSYLDLRARNGVLSDLAAFSVRQFKITEPDQVEEIWGEPVTGNYFDLVGVRAAHGRGLVAADDAQPGGSPHVVIGHALWTRRFNADPAVVGRSISINNLPLTIVGVAPREFTGMSRGLSSEIWIPVMTLPLLEPGRAATILTRGSRWLTLIGRLAPGSTFEQARARFDLLTAEMQADHPEEWRARQGDGNIRELFITVLRERDTRIHPELTPAVYGLVGLLVVVVNVVLLMACMNLASMLLARAIVRRKEMAIRLTLGATRWRLVRQLIAESLLLSSIAGAAGVVLTVWLLNLLMASLPALPEGIRIGLDVPIDWRVLTYAIAFSMLTGVLFGLAPALVSSRPDVSPVLKDESSAVTAGYRQSKSRAALVVLQVACSLLLLVGAGLMLRSLNLFRPASLGFSSDNILVVPLELDESRYDRITTPAFYRDLSDRVAALPGVRAVSLAEEVPGGFMTGSRRSTEIEGYQTAPDEALHLDSMFVGPRFFTNMNVPIVQGRDFDERDREGAPCVAIVNEAFARRYFPNLPSPLGKHLVRYGSSRDEREACAIVGVIRDDRWHSLEKAVPPFFALAGQQALRRRMTLLVHSDAEPSLLTQPVRRAVQALDPTIVVTDVSTLHDYFSAVLYPFRVFGIVMGACGVMALVIATIGIYGLVSYSAAQRTREVAIRVALGAVRTDILKMVVGQGMRLVAIGLVLGLLATFGLSQFVIVMLEELDLMFMSVADSTTFAMATMLLTVIAIVACLVPALRASKVDPIRAIRYE